MLILMNVRDLRVIANHTAQFAPERFSDAAHAARRLKQRRLHIVGIGVCDACPKT
jgi:hypothetical protein